MWKISSDFGNSWTKNTKYESSTYYYPGTNGQHYGVDQVWIDSGKNATIGKEIKSQYDGYVQMIVTDINSKSGLMIRILNDDLSKTNYMHLSEIKVKQGQVVKKGDVIGKAGNSGKYTTGPHLHTDTYFETKPENINFIKRIDMYPIRYYIYPNLQKD